MPKEVPIAVERSAERMKVSTGMARWSTPPEMPEETKSSVPSTLSTSPMAHARMSTRMVDMSCLIPSIQVSIASAHCVRACQQPSRTQLPKQIFTKMRPKIIQASERLVHLAPAHRLATQDHTLY